MKYMVLLYQDPKNFPTDEKGRQALFAAYENFTQSQKSSGAFVDGMPLGQPDQARTVKGNAIANGLAHNDRLPLVGYYILEYGSVDEAAKAATRIPVASSGGTIEVVPFAEM
jgi:hypothetical protein